MAKPYNVFHSPHKMTEVTAQTCMQVYLAYPVHPQELINARTHIAMEQMGVT